PPLTANVGLACYQCFEEDITLHRCSGCRRVSYCSPAHQLDWRLHKPMCKALSAMEKSRDAADAILSKTTTDVNVLNKMVGENIMNGFYFCESALLRYCFVFVRSEKEIRMVNGVDNSGPLIACPDCNLSFCCSPAHWEAARALHRSPCEETRGGLSQCETNREVCKQIKFERIHQLPERYKWAPPRVKSAWVSLTGLSWENEFHDENTLGVPPSSTVRRLIRAASDDLSMVMTILHGLEKLNDDDGWPRKHTLTIHIIGANEPEVSYAAHPVGFEEILHRLPEVKILKLVLCGPDIPGGHLQQKTFDCRTCPHCTQLGRKRIYELAADTYHGFVANRGSKFEKPDLCIAFNSGASMALTEKWLPTLKLLVERKIPSSFTSLDREESESEAALLRAAGATLHPALGPSRNPWGSMKMVPSSHKVYGFSSDSGWLAGGFS
ncbi:hypothetical protein C8R44DRAFT_923628, partial [Mycena epipterygia]